MEYSIKTNPQTKTLRFEARPMWETSIHAAMFSGDTSADATRNRNYEKVKKILDEYARMVICNATKVLAAERADVTHENLREYYNKALDRKDKDAAKAYERYLTSYKNHIAETIKEYALPYQLVKAQGALFSEKNSKLLSGELMPMTDEERELILMYKGFTSYFTKYFDSLSKTILCGTESGSISKRIIENIEQFFRNEAILKDIEQEYPILYEKLRANVEKMGISLCLTQEGIDFYNKLLGDTNNTGINSIISEYRSKEKVRVVGLRKLDKIPLCTIAKQRSVCKIESEDELIITVKESLSLCERLFAFAEEILCDSWIVKERTSIYVQEKQLARLSMKIYGRWDTLKRAVEIYCKANGYHQKEVVSLEVLEQAILNYEKLPNTNVTGAIKDMLEDALTARKTVSFIKKICKEGTVLKNKKCVKDFYEKTLLIWRALKVFETDIAESVLISQIVAMQNDFNEMNTIYNQVRNFCTQTPIKKETYPLYFNKSSFLSSLDYDKFENGTSVSSILRKDKHYYLLVLNPEVASRLPATARTTEGGFEQLVYKQLTGLNKMFPKVFLAKGNQEIYAPSAEILEIAEKKLYTKEANDRESLNKWIDFCISSFKKNPEWMKNFNISFKSPEEYESANEFYTETERRTIRMEFAERIDEAFLRKAVSKGDVFLFEIYNKDFSPYHRGNDSVYTKLFKEMLSAENLHKINSTDDTAIKLGSGGNSLTFRKASLPYNETHAPNIPIANKNSLNPKKESTFPYALCKDKRFMNDKYLLSIVVQIGFRNKEMQKIDLNKQVNTQILKNRPNVLAVRAAERHLLYYVVSDADGNILEQASLNIISSQGSGYKIQTNYKEVLAKREQEIMTAKEEWNYSKDIKDIKAGYLSHAVHQIVKLQEKYNAVIMLEDYSGKFVQGRTKNLTAVYQQFQAALLNKLSCIVPDKGNFNEALQLAQPVSSLEELKSQSGIVFFVNPSYTANVDPATGFVNLYKEIFHYESIKKSQEVLNNITDIWYEYEKKEFVLVINEKQLGVSSRNIEWSIHTGGNRTAYIDKKFQEYNCTDKLYDLFSFYKITGMCDIKEKSLPKAFYEEFFEILSVLFQMHYYSMSLDDEYTLSPVQNVDGMSFDSRKNDKNQPKNTAAVKTYMMLLKGLRDIGKIDKETMLISRDAKGTHKEEWLDYLRELVTSKR